MATLPPLPGAGSNSIQYAAGIYPRLFINTVDCPYCERQLKVGTMSTIPPVLGLRTEGEMVYLDHLSRGPDGKALSTTAHRCLNRGVLGPAKDYDWQADWHPSEAPGACALRGCACCAAWQERWDNHDCDY